MTAVARPTAGREVPRPWSRRPAAKHGYSMGPWSGSTLNRGRSEQELPLQVQPLGHCWQVNPDPP